MFRGFLKNSKGKIIIHFLIITTYIIYFFIVNENHVLKIESFGPTKTKAGQGFNIQPQGNSAIWIKTVGLRNDSVVAVWGDTKLDAFVHLEKQLVTVSIPEKLFSTPGNYEIYLIDFENNIRSNKVVFKVLSD